MKGIILGILFFFVTSTSQVVKEPLVFKVLWDGNSWVAGAGSTNGETFPKQTNDLLDSFGITAGYINFGVGGQTIQDMQSDAVTQIDTAINNYNVLVGLELFNQSGTKEVVYQMYKQYFIDRKAAGFKYILACTGHPAQYEGFPDWEDKRVYYTALMKAEFPALGIYVVDCGSDSRLLDPTNTTYFSTDSLHLTNAGQRIQAEYVYNKLVEIYEDNNN